MGAVPHGDIVFLDEIEKDIVKWSGRMVRVLAVLESYDPQENRASIELEGYRLAVDTSLLGVFSYHLNSLYQWIGELHVNNNKATHEESLILHARIMSNSDGLDIQLYRKAVQLRREYYNKKEND
ncbi:hypothetical protein BZG36_04263 [Bifiguratus adelaidae]|uniref:Uncharacterized protein n=1 Tax=Bifiguratus adelaidae TaxID=1938954 RepID=A0A261XVZ0_9FUNG|nr:hypothetical protein BZG36_04263 [Bifiguratus adelaidae]